MKALIHLALAAILATETVAYSSHRHLHRHLKARADVGSDMADTHVKSFTPSSSDKLGENEKTKHGIEGTTVNGKKGLLPEIKLEGDLEGAVVKQTFVKLKKEKGKNTGENEGETRLERVPTEIALDGINSGKVEVTGQSASVTFNGRKYDVDIQGSNNGEVKNNDSNASEVKNQDSDTTRGEMLPALAANLNQNHTVQNVANHNAPDDTTRNSMERITSKEEKIREPNNQGGSPQGTENRVLPVQDDNSRVQDTAREDASAPMGNSMQTDTFSQESSSKVKVVTHRDPNTKEVKTYKFTFGPSPQFEGNLKSSKKELDRVFPDGELSCSEFPTGYGAHPLTWLKESPEGYSSVQRLHKPLGWTWSLSQKKDYEIEGGNGKCVPQSFCAYACPPGYERTQWPKLQPKNGQSVGGLYCDAKGKLRVTRPEVKTLCKRTEQNIVLVNEMKKLGITLCCTVYPGNENMVIPIVAGPGKSTVVTNPPNWEYEIFNEATNTTKTTSKHCYLQPAGLSMSDGCKWRSTREPMISADLSVLTIGTSINKEGDTYFSVSQNLPKGPLDFATNVHVKLEVVGGPDKKCFYTGRGTFPNEKKENGCTLTAKKGQQGIIRISGPFEIKGNPDENPNYFKP